ncbi:MAG: thioredoxin domain-containing protein [Candidatus Magasanikbacteria bacterium]|nr:thioredoxin domain-containing protein [Candidatus Magasanikbacteria bacterium]
MTHTIKRIILWSTTILGLIVFVWLLAWLGTPKTNGGALSEAVSEVDNIKGNLDAKVVLVEYSDFQCPFCAQIYPIVKQLSSKFSPEDLGVVYRHYPLIQIHANAELAAQAAEAAGLQGKFWEMHDAIFNTQSTWSTLDTVEDFFISLANSIGLDTEKFKIDLNSSEVQNKVKRDVSSGNKSGVQGTPTFFINGQGIPTPQTYEDFVRVIENTLSALP